MPFEIIGFLDRNPKLQGAEISGTKVYSPESVAELEYDTVMLTTALKIDDIFMRLSKAGIPPERIDNHTALYCMRARNDFLRFQSEIIYNRNIGGNIAEGGVFEGYFATKMNRCFPDRKLYLFDTFEGFDTRSVTGDENISKNYDVNFFDDVIIENMDFCRPDNIIIKKGFFPESAAGISDEFCFVNLDFDLYQPTLDGLRFFYPRMVSGGVILIHDFFNEDFGGVSKAVNEFCLTNDINYNAIGDNISVVITK